MNCFVVVRNQGAVLRRINNACVARTRLRPLEDSFFHRPGPLRSPVGIRSEITAFTRGQPQSRTGKTLRNANR